MQSAWRGAYCGNNHQLLFDNINAIRRSEKPYSNQVALVQSSGSGKSRLVHELAKIIFSIPFNLREKDDNRGPFFVFDILGASDTNTDLAFPIPDDAVRDYLIKDSDNLKIKFLTFLGSVFKQINTELDKCHEEWKQISTAADLAEWWSGHLGSIRSELYKAAIEGTVEPIEVRIREDGEMYHRYSLLW